jgi:hypothetical protein
MDQERETKGVGDNSWLDNPLGEAPIFTHINDWAQHLKNVYTGPSFGELLYGDLPEFDKVLYSIEVIRSSLS